MTWNYDRAELLTDGIIHVAGLCLALIGAIALTSIVCHTANGVEAASIVVYAAGLLLMLGLSAAYSLWPPSPRKWLLRRFDQSAIFWRRAVMIALQSCCIWCSAGAGC